VRSVAGGGGSWVGGGGDFFHEVADRFGEQRHFVRRDRAVVVFRCVVQRRIGEQEVRDHRQAPTRYLHLRRVPVARCGGPCVHHLSADQADGDLEDDGGDIVAAEEALAILERLRGKPIFRPQSFSEGAETDAIGGEQIGREACVRQAALLRFHDASRIPGNDEFARGTLQGVRSGGPPDREGLN